MPVYQKLLRIQWNQKYFDVFCDEKHRRTFLEVRKQDNSEKYYYPLLSDYVYLDSIYNKKSDGILKIKKFSFSQKLVIGGMCVVIGASFFPLLTSSDVEIHLDNHLPSTSIETDIENETIEENTNMMEIFLQDLSVYGFPSATFQDLRNSADSNFHIDLDSRAYVNAFINTLAEKEPDAEIRILNENLKTLNFEITPNDKWDMPGVDAYYNSSSNTIHLKEHYESEEYKITVIIHELGHVMNNMKLKQHGKTVYLSYYIYENGYGKSLSEGLDTVFTTYLTSDYSDTFFDFPYQTFTNYQQTAAITYQIVKLLNYNFTDYLKGNILELKEKLKKENLENLIDALDAHLETEDASDITIEEENLLRENVTLLLTKRLKQELEKNKECSLLESYQFAETFLQQFQFLYNDYYFKTSLMKLFEVCNEVKKEENSPVKICGVFDYSLGDANFQITSKNQVLVEKQVDQLYFYPTLENGKLVMRFYYLEKSDQWRAYDTETNQEIDFLNTVSIPVQGYINTLLPVTASHYQLKVDNSVFQTDDFHHFMEKELTLELAKEKDMNQILNTTLKGENYCKDMLYPTTLEECKEQILKNRIEKMYELGYSEMEIHEMITSFPLENMLKYQIETPGIYHFTGLATGRVTQTIMDQEHYLAGTAKLFEKDGVVSAYAPKFFIYPIIEDDSVSFGLCVLEAIDRTEDSVLTFAPYDVVTREPIDENAPCISLDVYLQRLGEKYHISYNPLKYNIEIDISFLKTRDLSEIVISELGDLLTQYDPIPKEAEKQR